MKKAQLAQLIFSLFLVYHLMAILIMPNPGSYVERHFGFLFYGYTSTLGINTPWQFFSPNPATKMFYEYEIIENEGSDSLTQTYRWPPEKNHTNMIGANYKRLIYHSWYTTSSEERKSKFLMNYLCRKHPSAISISLKSFSEKVPPMERFRFDKLSLAKAREYKSWSIESFDCPQMNEESENARPSDVE
ncbi:MAG: hypothetical protein KDD34_02875 [Bdellovibrionales bacterium]|nr:hypothetical protein [Bdellovibrionales bacterium]